METNQLIEQNNETYQKTPTQISHDTQVSKNANLTGSAAQFKRNYSMYDTRYSKAVLTNTENSEHTNQKTKT